MLTYERVIESKDVQGHHRHDASQFDLLHADVEKKYDEAEVARLSKRPR